MLKVNKINVFYGKLQVLWDVSLEVNKGEKVVLVGSNGAGKTTTLKTISGLLHPTTGSVEYLGKRIDNCDPHIIVEYGIAHIPEGRMLFSDMTVQENLEMGAYTRRARTKISDSLEWVFRLFPRLKERRNQLARTLSGGEGQMLAIGRGLMSRPSILMLDEPSLGLAPKLVTETFEMIDQVSKEEVVVLLVEQNVQHALEIADRGYVLENGRIALQGSAVSIIKNEHLKKAYLGM